MVVSNEIKQNNLRTMLLSILLTIIVILIVILSFRMIVFIRDNRTAHQYFKKNLPNLPVLPKPNIFNGHSNELYFSPKNWRNFDESHKKYGTTFGWYHCNKPSISTIDVDLIKKLVIDESQLDRLDLEIPLKEFKDDNIAFARTEQWSRLRKAIAPAFTNHKVMSPNVQEAVNDVINRFLDSIQDKLKQSGLVFSQKTILFDADDLFQRYTLALVFSCFYKQHDIIDFNSQEEFYVKIIDKTTRTCVNPLVVLCIVFPVFIPVVEWLIVKFHPQGFMVRKVRDFIKQQTLLNLRAKKQLEKAKQMGLNKDSSREDFIMDDGTRFKLSLVDYVVDQFHAGKLTETEYIHSTFFLFHAANKTLADALSKLVYHLAVHQDVQDKLRDSILVDGIDSDYLQWCIDESLRLFPPVMGGCSRVLDKDIETKVGLLPAGTHFWTPAFSVCRNREYWGPDADEFKPDRWLNSSTFNPVQYIAFGTGKRNCLGREFALNGMKKLLVELIGRYKFLTSPKTNAETIMEFSAPGLIFLVPDFPTYIKLCELEH